MKRTADDIIKINNTLKDYIWKACNKDAVDKNYIMLQVPEMLDHEIMEELVEDLWWMKHYDRTYFIVKPTIWVGIKNNISGDEQWNIINKIKKEDCNPIGMCGKVKTVDVRAKDGSVQYTYIDK